MAYEITASLINSWQWFMDSDDDHDEDARSDFLKALNREWSEPNEAMQKGLDFESDVEKFCEGTLNLAVTGDPDYQKCIFDVAAYVKGGAWQMSLAEDVMINGIVFRIKGRLDVLKGAWIYDLKYSGTFETGKYFNCPQSRFYMRLVPEVVGIKYLIADGSRVYTDEYLREDVEPVEPLIWDFHTWLGNYPKLKTIYIEKWSKP